MEVVISKRILSVLCATIMVSISLNNILADVPPQPDTFIDEYYESGGRQHMVWREYDNGSYLIKYSNNI
ncbi:MAG: hypothetical protein KAJ33_05705, partial [Thermoplasmata archaeon]|nr:hypothetical protein [Thermoplasmata archaeon]